MNVFSIFNSLSPREKEFLQTEQINAEETQEEWVSFFRKVLAFDEQADSKRKKYMLAAIASLILVPVAGFLIFSLFAVILPLDFAAIAFVPAFIVSLIFLAAMIFAFYKYFKLKKFNIKCNDAIKNKVLPVLNLLREEVKPNQKIKLQLDLTNPQSKEKLVGESPAYAKGVYHKVVDSDYRNNWMKGETVFADGTRLIWDIHDLVRQQQKTKRNPRGKYKTKYKYKTKTFISLQAGVDRRKFSLPRLKEKSGEGLLRTKKQGQYDWMQVKRTFKLGENEFNVKYLIDTIASVYMRAKPQGENK